MSDPSKKHFQFFGLGDGGTPVAVVDSAAQKDDTPPKPCGLCKGLLRRENRGAGYCSSCQQKINLYLWQNEEPPIQFNKTSGMVRLQRGQKELLEQFCVTHAASRKE